jgi:hypothetical protein
VYRWAKADIGFAQRLKDARAWRRAFRVEAREAASFNEPVAEMLLLRVRRGEPIRALVRDPSMPGRDQLNRWKRERPDFAARLEEAWRFSSEVREKRRGMAFDQDAADRVIVRLSNGETVPEVLADPALPGAAAVRRWLVKRPDFAATFETAKIAGHRARMRRRRKLTPELQHEIMGRLLAGASLLAVSRLPHMPHYVTLHAWMRRDPDFEHAMRFASEERDIELAGQAYRMVMGVTEDTARERRRLVGPLYKRIGRMARKPRNVG